MRNCFKLLMAGYLIISALPASAQPNRPVITPDNAGQLVEVGLLGQGFFTDLQWSPDGDTLAVTSSAGLWLYTSDQPPHLIDDYGGFASLAYHPDGTRLAVGQFDQTLILDVATGTAVQRLVGTAHTLAFSPDGKFLAIEGARQVKLRDVTTGAVVHAWPNNGGLNDLAFDLRGRYLAGGDGHPKMTPHIYVWDTWTGEMVVDEQAIDDMVLQVAIDPWQPVVAAGGYFGNVQLYDFKAHAFLQELDASSGSGDLVYSADGASLFTVSRAGAVQTWDTTTYQATSWLADSGNALQALSPDQTRLASAAAGTVIWRDVATGEQRVFPGSEIENSTFWFSPDGTLLATGNLNQGLNVWDMATRMNQGSWADYNVFALAFSPDNTRMAWAHNELTVGTNPVVVWTIGNDQPDLLLNDLPYVRDLQFSPDGTQLAVMTELVSGQPAVLILDPATGDTIETLDLTCCKILTGLNRYTTDGLETFVYHNLLSTYAIYNAHTAQLTPLPAEIRKPIQFSPDRRLLATYMGEQLEVWDTHTWEKQLYPVNGQSRIIDFDPTGSLLVIGNRDPASIEVWDTATGERLFQHALTDSIDDVAFSPDGTLLVTAGEDGVARLWGIAP